MKESFAIRLKKALELRDMKQSELSVSSGISKSRISQYLRGTYEAKQDAVYTLAKSLNVSEAWLMGYDIPSERRDETTINLSDNKQYEEETTIHTLAAHATEELTADEIDKIMEFALMLKSTRKQREEAKSKIDNNKR